MSIKHKLLTIVGLLSLALWACRPTEVVIEETPSPTPVKERSVAQTVVVTVEKTVVVAERETVQVVVTSTPTPIPEGGLVTRISYADAQTVNPIMAADPNSAAFVELMFEGLLRVDPFTGEWVPNLAAGWTISDDGLVYTFTLREGLRWSDGEPITMQDLNFTYAALMSGKLDTPNFKLVADITQIEVLDDRTAAVTFARPDCAHLSALQFGWLPMHVFTDDVASYDWEDLAGHEFNSRPTVFSGPFMFQEWVRGDHWSVERNPRYWRGAPHLDGVINRVVDGQQAMIEMLTEGEVDLAAGFDPQYLTTVESVPDLNLFKFLSDEYDLLGFQMGNPEDPQPRLTQEGVANGEHGQHPILQDKQVRQAVVYALDRTELVAQARLGQGIPLHSNVLPTVSWAYNTDLAPRAYDPDKARQMLDEAGWQVSPSGVRVKGGRALRLKLYTNAGNQVRETMAALVRQQLAEVGIEVEVNAVEWYQFLEVLFGQTFDLVLVSWSNLGVDPHDDRLWLAQNDVPGQGTNFVSYYDPELEALYAQVAALPACDQDARAAIYRQIQARLYEEQPYCWLDVPRQLVAINHRVGGVNPGPWSIWYNVHEWYVNDGGRS